MNKKILLAALGLTLTGLAHAQSNVTLYGVADVGLQYYKTPNGTQAREQSGIQSGSRWGLRGSEDLGGGLKANFTLESSISVDTGAGNSSALFDRRSTVGLSGGFGVVELGRRDTPLFDVLNALEPSGAGSSLGLNDILTKAGRGYTRRISNQFRYETPNLGGFKGQLLYGLGESNTTNGTEDSLNDVIGLSAAYSNGPLYLGYAYQSSKDASTLGTGPLASVTTGVTLHKFNTLGASYDFSSIKFTGFYYTDKRNSTPLTPVEINQRIYALGAAVPLGVHTIAAQYGKVKDKVNRIAGPADARQVSVSYLYSLSKRTNFYAGYTDIRNDHYTSAVGGFTAYSTAFFDTTASSTATNSVTAKSSAWSFGIRHQF